jgi:hypothetical protein
MKGQTSVFSPSLFIQKDSIPGITSDSFSDAKRAAFRNTDQYPDFMSQHSNGARSEAQTFGQARSPN